MNLQKSKVMLVKREREWKGAEVIARITQQKQTLVYSTGLQSGRGEEVFWDIKAKEYNKYLLILYIVLSLG